MLFSQKRACKCNFVATINIFLLFLSFFYLKSLLFKIKFLPLYYQNANKHSKIKNHTKKVYIFLLSV